MLNTYEVELIVRHKSVPHRRAVTRTEYATCASDAVFMAMLNVNNGTSDIVKIEFVHIGPPAELVRAHATLLQQALRDAVEKSIKA